KAIIFAATINGVCNACTELWQELPMVAAATEKWLLKYQSWPKTHEPRSILPPGRSTDLPKNMSLRRSFQPRSRNHAYVLRRHWFGIDVQEFNQTGQVPRLLL